MDNPPKPSDVFRRKPHEAGQPPKATTAEVEVSPAANTVPGTTEHGERDINSPETFTFTRARVKFIHPEKGFGFCVVTDPKTGTSQDVFFHMGGFRDYTLDYDSEPKTVWDTDIKTPELSRGDMIALAYVVTPDQPQTKADTKQKGSRAEGWTTVTRADEIEWRLQERAKKYPVGVYYYPKHPTFLRPGVFPRDPVTDGFITVQDGFHSDVTPFLIFHVDTPGEFPHGTHRYIKYDEIYSLMDPPLVNAQREITIVEGAEALTPPVRKELSDVRREYDAFVRMIPALQENNVSYRVSGDEFVLRVGDYEVKGEIDFHGKRGRELPYVGRVTDGDDERILLPVRFQRWFETEVYKACQESSATEFSSAPDDAPRMASSLLIIVQEVAKRDEERLPWLERLLAACERGDVAKEPLHVIMYGSEKVPGDQEHIDALINKRQAIIDELRTEIDTLSEYAAQLVRTNPAMDDKGIHIAEFVIPTEDNMISASRAWSMAVEAGDGMNSLAEQVSVSGMGGAALVGGLRKEEFCAKYTGVDDEVSRVVFDAVVAYSTKFPDITSQTERGILGSCQSAVDFAIRQCESKLEFSEAQMTVLRDVAAEGTYATLYDLELVFNARWAERTRRHMAASAIDNATGHKMQ